MEHIYHNPNKYIFQTTKNNYSTRVFIYIYCLRNLPITQEILMLEVS
jgi:hypothetical protein